MRNPVYQISHRVHRVTEFLSRFSLSKNQTKYSISESSAGSSERRKRARDLSLVAALSHLIKKSVALRAL